MTLKFIGAEQNKLYSPELNNMANLGSIAVASGCLVTYSSVFDISIASGSILFSGSVVSVSSDTKTIDSNPTEFTRIDVILINTSGVISVLKGNPSAIPTPGDYDTTLFTAIALVFVYPSVTSLTSDDIRDIRVINSIGTGAFTGDIIPSADNSNVVGTSGNRFASSHITKNTTEEIEFVELPSTPTTPSSGNVLLYAKNDKKLYYLDSTGVEKELSTGLPFWLTTDFEVYDDFSGYPDGALTTNTNWTIVNTLTKTDPVLSYGASETIVSTSNNANGESSGKEVYFYCYAGASVSNSASATASMTSKLLESNKHTIVKFYGSLSMNTGKSPTITITFNSVNYNLITGNSQKATTFATDFKLISKGSDNYDGYIGGKKIFSNVNNTDPQIKIQLNVSDGGGSNSTCYLYIADIYQY